MHSTDSPASLAESVHAQLTDAAAGAVAATTQRPSMSALSPDWCFIIHVHTKLDSLVAFDITHTHSQFNSGQICCFISSQTQQVDLPTHPK